MSYDSTILGMSGLVSYWGLHETSGTNAADTVDSNPGTITGTAGTNYTLNQAGPIGVGAGILLDGTAGFITVGDPANLNPTAAISVAAWVKYTSASITMEVIRKRTFGYSLGTAQVGNGGTAGRMSFAIEDSVPTIHACTDATTSNDGNWHFFVGTYDGANVRLYRDGNAVGTPAATSVAIAYGAGGTSIGRDGNTAADFFAGTIAGVAVFSRAISSSEVAVLNTEGLTVAFTPHRMPLGV